MLIAVGIVSVPAFAASTYTVDNTVSCSDSGSGSSAQPFCTIGAAAKKAVAGDTVLVRAGTYAGTSVNPTNSGTSISPITFTANPGVLISGGTRAFALSSRSSITINGFTINGTSSYGISVSGGSGVVISNNTVSGTGAAGIYLSGGSGVTVSNNTVSFAGQPVSGLAAVGISLSNVAGGVVSGNVTHDNSAHGIYLANPTSGVTVLGNTSYRNAYQYQRNANGINVTGPGNTIVGNVTYANEDTGINIYPVSTSAPGADNTVVAGNLTYGNGDHGIDDLNVTGGRITGNTVVGNCTSGINVEGTSGNYVIENNVAVNNATGVNFQPTPISGTWTNDCTSRSKGNIRVADSAPATSTANFNLVWQAGAATEYQWAGGSYATQPALFAATGQEAAGIFADPRFVDLAGNNFQLSAGSPAIDSADSAATGQQATDLAGHPRVDDPATPNTGTGPRAFDDRGAYEYQPPAATGPTAALTVTPHLGHGAPRGDRGRLHLHRGQRGDQLLHLHLR